MKKLITVSFCHSAWSLISLSCFLAAYTLRADQTKANNNTALQSGGSWVSGTAPGAGDNAIWNSTVSTTADCTNTLGSAVTWKSISITNPSAPIQINGSTTLTLNNGINMVSATKNLVLNCGTVTVASNQTWTVASGMTLTTGSATNAGSVNNGNIVTKAGSGTWVIGGTGDNNSLGVTVSAGTVKLNKTSSGGVHAIGGAGLTVNSGATAQITGTGGDQIYDGGGVTINGTLDMYGNNEAINGLNGSGTVTTTLSGGTPTLTVSGSGGTFTGTIEANASGSITLTTSGSAVQSVACITSGSSTAGPYVNVNGGTLTLNGTLDNSYAEATVASGATLLLDKTSSSSVHAIGGDLTINSGGTAQITGTGGDQIYDANDVTVNGTFDLNGNSETINGLNGSGTVTTTLSGGTPTLTVGTDGDSGTFTGTIQADASGSITLTKAGTGSQAIACVTSGSSTAGPYINVNGGTLTLNGTVDNTAAEATVNSGGTLLLAKTSSSSVHAIGINLTINSGGTAQITGTGGSQIYHDASVNVSGTFDLNGNSETVGSLAFSGGVLQNSSTVNGILTDAATLSMNGNVTVNYPNAPTGSNVVLQYSSGERSGTGSFVAGNVPAGMTVVDNTSTMTVSVVSTNGYGSTSQFPTSFPAIVVPSLNPYEIVVAAATPQEYGAKGDGITDDSGAFQAAINAVYNSGGNGGGVVYVPDGDYAFYTNLNIPTGVTLQGDWQDWTKGTGGLVGTTLKVYYGAGHTNASPFLVMSDSGSLKDLNIWYPNQNPNSITPYPFTIQLAGNTVVQNVALVNSYQGIEVYGQPKWILSTVVGTPLYRGLFVNGLIADICQSEDVRFNPNIWPASGLTNAPSVGGSYATWMKANGTGMLIEHVDGLLNNNTEISGYNYGLDFENDPTAGPPGCSFYNGHVTNCAVAMYAQEDENTEGLEFSYFTLDGGIGINRNNTTDDITLHFSDCTIIGRNGTAVYSTASDQQNVMAFQNCAITGTMQLAGPGVFNLVNCSLTASTQCVMSASATRAAFTGCTFSPSQNIVNNGNAGNLIMDSRRSSQTVMPIVNWTNVVNRYIACGPAKASLFNAMSYGATGNGTTDDTAAINAALTAAGNNGGGIVYLPAGHYRTSSTLSVPGGVELRGAYELRHSADGAGDGNEKGSVIHPTGGQGTTSGPPAVTLAANAGLVGLTFDYPNQINNVAYPPTIQGRGGNVYAVGVFCADPWIFVDLDTYTCTNHLFYMLDGWALSTWIHAGNGSSGIIADTHGNPTYWLDLPSSMNSINWSVDTTFASTNSQVYVLGNCTELFMKVFFDSELEYMHCTSENNQGPNVTAISATSDGCYQDYVFSGSGTCTFTNVNAEWWVAYGPTPAGSYTNSCALISTTNFTGTARFLNVPFWGEQGSIYEVNGGDIGLELVQLSAGSLPDNINGGVFHLINASDINGNGTISLAYGANTGIAGDTNEFIGCYAYDGCSVSIDNVTNNAYAVWNDYALNFDSVLDLGPVLVGNFYPNGTYQFQASNALTFQAASANGINTSGITVQLTGTNLLGQSYSTNYTSANGLTIGGSFTARTMSAPLLLNTIYVAVTIVTDASGNETTNTLSFDTINPAYYTFEVEDFDYSGGGYINNPQTNAYAGLSGVAGVDYTNNEIGTGSASYRPQGLETEGAGDIPRLAYSGGLQDYDVGFADRGNWGNYTRLFPAGTYYIFMRSASPNGPTSDSDSMYQVTAGRGTANQTTSLLGTFSAVNTGGWQTYAWVPLRNSSGGMATFTGGSVETLRVTADNGDNNINCYMLVPTNNISDLPYVSGSILEAEYAILTGGAAVANNHTGYSGAGFVDGYYESTTADTKFDVNISSAGQYTLAVRYSAGNGTSSNTALYVNGIFITNLICNATADWNTWAIENQQIALNGGDNTIEFKSLASVATCINLDYITLTVLAMPTLSIQSVSASQGLTLQWPDNGNTDVSSQTNLYYTPGLTPPVVWTVVTNTPVLSNGQWTVTLPLGTNSTGFYGLQ